MPCVLVVSSLLDSELVEGWDVSSWFVMQSTAPKVWCLIKYLLDDFSVPVITGR